MFFINLQIKMKKIFFVILIICCLTTFFHAATASVAPAQLEHSQIKATDSTHTSSMTLHSDPVQPLASSQKEEPKKLIAEFLPHRAEYAIELNSKDSKSEISNIKGSLTVQIIDTGDGWAFEQHSVLQVYYNLGYSDQYITTIASWESKDGGRYRFNVRSLRNGAEEEFMKGDGSVVSSQAGHVTYQLPVKADIVLPVGTLFPLQHLKQAIAAAIAGENVFSNKVVFDGSSDTREPVDVNVLINPIPKSKIVVDNPGLLSTDKMWSLQMAIFARGSRNPEPDYEITQTVLPSGIITSMIMGYGEAGFSTKLILKKVDIFPKSTDNQSTQQPKT